MPTNIPSFIYNTPTKPAPTPATFEFGLDLACDHVIFLLCLENFVCVLLNAYGIIRTNYIMGSMLKLEVTAGDMCVLLPVLRLPMCTVFCRIKMPVDVAKLAVYGPWYARKFSLNWDNISITNTLTNHTILVSEIIKQKKPFFCVYTCIAQWVFKNVKRQSTETSGLFDLP